MSPSLRYDLPVETGLNFTHFEIHREGLGTLKSGT